MSIGFTRILLAITSFFIVAVCLTGSENWVFGLALGLTSSVLLVGADIFFQRCDLRIFNFVLVGLFVGYVMAQLLISAFSLLFEVPQILRGVTVLLGVYFGVSVTLRSADSFYFAIPFVRLSTSGSQKRDLLLDSTALADPRLLDLCNSGLLDRALIFPRFLVRDVQSKKNLDILKNLEAIPDLGLRYSDVDFPELTDPVMKAIRLARALNVSLLVSDLNHAQYVEGVKLVNLQFLSNPMRSLMQIGEQIKIKIQRYGKEPLQGVGYLEDGTMVVVNGGGQYLGETVGAWVLSVKQTASGRIVFCNAEEGALSIT